MEKATMTEDELKEMYLSLGKGEKWEYKPNDMDFKIRNDGTIDDLWTPYKLGDVIDTENYVYRKVKKFIDVLREENSFHEYYGVKEHTCIKVCEKFMKDFVNNFANSDKKNIRCCLEKFIKEEIGVPLDLCK